MSSEGERGYDRSARTTGGRGPLGPGDRRCGVERRPRHSGHAVESPLERVPADPSARPGVGRHAGHGRHGDPRTHALDPQRRGAGRAAERRRAGTRHHRRRPVRHGRHRGRRALGGRLRVAGLLPHRRARPARRRDRLRARGRRLLPGGRDAGAGHGRRARHRRRRGYRGDRRRPSSARGAHVRRFRPLHHADRGDGAPEDAALGVRPHRPRPPADAGGDRPPGPAVHRLLGLVGIQQPARADRPAPPR